ncbi:hypothetical protein SNEBB_007046 [Seison nebaliae]|nr:hypothetical protein SNEBB_007046 [Seison nebaliae]
MARVNKRIGDSLKQLNDNNTTPHRKPETKKGVTSNRSHSIVVYPNEKRPADVVSSAKTESVERPGVRSSSLTNYRYSSSSQRPSYVQRPQVTSVPENVQANFIEPIEVKDVTPWKRDGYRIDFPANRAIIIHRTINAKREIRSIFNELFDLFINTHESYEFPKYYLLEQNCFASANNSFHRREYSLTLPYNDLHWDVSGDAIITNRYIRLTSDEKSKNGALWSTTRNRMQNWQIELEYSISGHGKHLSGDGIAFWYSPNGQKSGPVFGNEDYFTGLGVFIDTYNNQQQTNVVFPYLVATINNGSSHYDVGKDGFDTKIGGCELNTIRNRNDYGTTLLIISYYQNTLRIETDETVRSGRRICFSRKGVILPKSYYFGVSAATGDLTDNHDIYSVKAFEFESTDTDMGTLDQPSIDNTVDQIFNDGSEGKSNDNEKKSGGLGRMLKIFAIILVVAAVVVALVIWARNHFSNQTNRLF